MGIKIDNISKSYGRQKALDEVSFSVETGELVGFLGPNGAGKSTLMKIITGFLAADSGSVVINGELMIPETTSIRKQIGYLPENNPLYTDMYVKEYLDICAGFYHLQNKKNRIAELVELTGLKDEQHKKIRMLSKGYRQRVGLAQALIHDPMVLILDEPTTGLDPNQIEEIRSLIRSVSQNKTVLFSTHIMQEVEALCERAIIINKGTVVADNRVEILKSSGIKRQQTVLIEFAEEVNPDKLNNNRWIKSIRQMAPQSLMVEASGEEDIRPLLFNFCIQHRLTLLTLQEQVSSMENVFQDLTRKTIE